MAVQREELRVSNVTHELRESCLATAGLSDEENRFVVQQRFEGQTRHAFEALVELEVEGKLLLSGGVHEWEQVLLREILVESEGIE